MQVHLPPLACQINIKNITEMKERVISSIMDKAYNKTSLNFYKWMYLDCLVINTLKIKINLWEDVFSFAGLVCKI